MDNAASKLPRAVGNKTVLLLMGGQAFRSGIGGAFDMPCLRSSMTAQLEASTSLRTQLVEPLERLRAHVEVAFTFPQCAQQSRTSELIRAVERVFRPRVVASSIVLSSSMANGWAALYQLLARVQRSRGAPFDYVLQA
jgi:hypothetical protein